MRRLFKIFKTISKKQKSIFFQDCSKILKIGKIRIFDFCFWILEKFGFFVDSVLEEFCIFDLKFSNFGYFCAQICCFHLQTMHFWIFFGVSNYWNLWFLDLNPKPWFRDFQNLNPKPWFSDFMTFWPKP